MTIFDMLEQSGVLTLLGMAVVFGFLVILVICVSIMGRVFQAFGVNKETPSPAAAPAQAQPAASSDQAVTAAIASAVNQYRKDNS